MDINTNIQRSKFIQDLTDNGIPVILTVPGHPINFISLINNQNAAVTVLLYFNKVNNNYYLLFNKSSIVDSLYISIDVHYINNKYIILFLSLV